MTLLHVNATPNGWMSADCQGVRLSDALDALPAGQPVVIMIHGFRYQPGVKGRDPHDQILSADGQPARGLPSWPRHLGLGDGADQLMIAFGWPAGGTLWTARRQAIAAGRALAMLVDDIGRLSPGRAVSVMAHSLGARVLLAAFDTLPAGSIWRALLLFPATFHFETERALRTPAARTCEIVNVTSSENRFFDLAHALLTYGALGRPLGRGLGATRPGWIDLRIDCSATLRGLGELGFRIAPPQRKVCHWSSYMRPGIFSLYRALIAVPGALSLASIEQSCQPSPHLRALPINTQSLSSVP